MATRSTRRGRTIVRRGDGVVAIRRTAWSRRALPFVVEALLALAPLVFVLGFVLPVGLVPIPPLVLTVGAWFLFRASDRARAPQPATGSRVVALRSARGRRRRQ